MREREPGDALDRRAASIATPAAPSPRSSRISVNAPPNEWPMMIGGRSSSRMIVVVVVDDLGDAEVLDRRTGRRAAARCRRPCRASAGATRVAAALGSARPSAPSCSGVIHSPWISTMVLGGVLCPVLISVRRYTGRSPRASALRSSRARGRRAPARRLPGKLAVGNRDHDHVGGCRRAQAVAGVLDRRRGCGIDAELAGGRQVHVRRTACRGRPRPRRPWPRSSR